jgi:hypothetical protein
VKSGDDQYAAGVIVKRARGGVRGRAGWAMPFKARGCTAGIRLEPSVLAKFIAILRRPAIAPAAPIYACKLNWG